MVGATLRPLDARSAAMIVVRRKSWLCVIAVALCCARIAQAHIGN